MYREVIHVITSRSSGRKYAESCLPNTVYYLIYSIHVHVFKNMNVMLNDYNFVACYDKVYIYVYIFFTTFLHSRFSLQFTFNVLQFNFWSTSKQKIHYHVLVTRHRVWTDNWIY
jgi:hypothetical protein